MQPSISRDKFLELAKQYNVVPVHKSVVFDLDTPVSIFIKAGGYDKPYSFLLESVVGGEKRGRYSIIGLKPFGIVYGKAGTFYYQQGDEPQETLEKGDAIFALEEVVQRFNAYQDENISGFSAGAVGFFSYDIIRYYERINRTETFSEGGRANSDLPDPLGVNDMVYTLPEQVILFDHTKGSLTFIQNVFLTEGDAGERYDQALGNMNDLIDTIEADTYQKKYQQLKRPKVGSGDDVSQQADLAKNWQSNTSNEEYSQMVLKAQEYMKAGDIFQVVLSKRFYREYTYDAFFLYRALRVTNPSPYMFYLNFPGEVLIGSSPEILVQKEKDQVLVRPIAGTAKRGRNDAEDEELARVLLADKKEIAEHVMLVDLGRNDVGRIAKPGSVSVTEMMIIEKYSHVMHIVSNVTGTLQDKYNAFSALWATLPAGTVSGAPKVRAMQIIEELEKEVRGVYSGCIGYFGFDGNMDSAIALRTMLVRDQTLFVQAGAGLVYDSDPEKENEECFKKAQALFRALELFYSGEIK